MNPDNSFFAKAYNPIHQAAIVFGGMVVFTMMSKLVKLTGLLSVSEKFPWMTTAAFLLFFAMFNSIFALSTKNMNQYWNRSVASFVVLVLMSGGLAYLTSGIWIDDAGSYRWIYIVVSIGYVIFLSMMTFMKNIVEFAQKEEWNQPRIRSDRRKKRK